MLSHTGEAGCLRGRIPGKLLGFRPYRRLEKPVPASVKVSTVSAMKLTDSPARRTAKLTESRELFFFFSWLQPEGHHSIPELIKAVKIISPKPDVDAPN